MITPEKRVVSFDSPTGLSPAGRSVLLRLEQKIPTDLRGMFGLILSDAIPADIIGIQFAPNPALRMMNRLLEHAGVEPHRNAEHKPGETQSYKDEEFQKILAAENNAMVPGSALDSHPLVYARTGSFVAKNYADEGLTYRFSMSLSQLLAHPTLLSHSEQARLRKVVAQLPVPENLRGVFTCDVVEGPQGTMLGAIGIDPNMVLNRVATELLAPVLAPCARHVDTPIQRAGIRPHWRPFMLEHDAFAAFADSLPVSGRTRAG